MTESFSCAINFFLNEGLSQGFRGFSQPLFWMVIAAVWARRYYRQRMVLLSRTKRIFLILTQVLPFLAFPTIGGAIFYRGYDACRSRADIIESFIAVANKEAAAQMNQMLFGFFIGEQIRRPSDGEKGVALGELFSQSFLQKMKEEPEYLERLREARFNTTGEVMISLEQKWQLSQKLKDGQTLFIALVPEEGSVKLGTLAVEHTPLSWKIDAYEIKLVEEDNMSSSF